MGGGGVFATLILLCTFTLIACPTDTGDEGPPPPVGVDLYDILPEPETYTTQRKTIPPIFKSYLGANINSSNWEDRRKELLQIMQHYLLGYAPPTEGITSTINSVAETTFNMSISNGDDTASFNVTYYLPTGTPPEGGWPMVMAFGNAPGDATAQRSAFLNNGIAVLATSQANFDDGDNEAGYMYRNNSVAPGNRGGAVHVLFKYAENGQYGWSARSGHDGTMTNPNPTNYRDLTSRGNPDAPGVLINWAWGYSRVLDALEAEAAKPEAERKIYVNVRKSSIFGTSRNGKGALIAGAFDDRWLVTNPVSSGSGGVVLERWVATAASQAQVDGNLPISTLNMNWYYIKVGNTITNPGASSGSPWYWTVPAAEALVNPALPPVTEDTVGTGTANATGYYATYSDNTSPGANFKPGYTVVAFGRNTDAIDGKFQGTQTLLDCRWAYPGWFGTRFWGFPNLHPNTNIAFRPNRGDNTGWLDNAPFDMHFVTSAVAPRGLLYHDGIQSNNTSPEGGYFSYLVTRETYRMLGVENRIGHRQYNIGHGNPAAETAELVAFQNALIAGRDPGAYFRQNTFPLNDPRTSWNYKYMDWAAPGKMTLKAQVEAGYTYADNQAPVDLPLPSMAP